MNTIIIDDDEISVLALEKCLQNFENVNVIGKFNCSADALNYLETNTCDLIFLDIEMPEMSGLEFLQNMKKEINVVIVSSAPKYAAESYDFEVLDYVVKPVNKDRILKSLEKAEKNRKTLEPSQSEAIFIKSKNGLERIELGSIILIEALADYVQIHTDKGRHVMLSTMKAMEKRLDSQKFVRIHRSFIVAQNKIEAIQDNNVIIGEEKYPISRSYRQDLMVRIKGV